MGTIYACPEEFEVPRYEGNYDLYKEKEKTFLNKVKGWAKERGSSDFAGEVVRFPVADGYAYYVILSLRPVKLIHVPIGDAWKFQYANRLTASDLKKAVEGDRKLEELFSHK